MASNQPTVIAAAGRRDIIEPFEGLIFMLITIERIVRHSYVMLFVLNVVVICVFPLYLPIGVVAFAVLAIIGVPVYYFMLFCKRACQHDEEEVERGMDSSKE